MTVTKFIRHQRGKVHLGCLVLVMGSKDKFFLVSGPTHSHFNRVIWWKNNKVISS
jgi:hypothetical protein